MIWIIIIPVLLAVMLGGYSLAATATFPTLTFGWWMLLVLAAASAAVSYWSHGRRRVMWMGIVVTILSVIVFVTVTTLNWNSATERTSRTPGATPPAASASGTPEATPPAAPRTPPPETPAATGVDLATPVGIFLGRYGLMIPGGIIAVLFLGFGAKWLIKSAGGLISGSVTALVALVMVAIAIDGVMTGFSQTRAIWTAAQVVWGTPLELPGTSTAGSTGGSTSSRTITTNSSSRNERVTVPESGKVNVQLRPGTIIEFTTTPGWCVDVGFYADAARDLASRTGLSNPGADLIFNGPLLTLGDKLRTALQAREGATIAPPLLWLERARCRT